MTKRKIMLLYAIITLVAQGSQEAPYKGLELIESQTMDIELKLGSQTDNSRIYLDEGAIWASRDISRIDPELDISIGEEVIVEEGKLVEELKFTINTNYSYYITRWELSIYRGDDINLQGPIETIGGEEVKNDMDISWSGIEHSFEVGEQLLFRLKAWDKDGNLDVTTTGVVDLVKDELRTQLEEMGLAKESKRSYGEASLMRHNIPVNAGMARFIGSGLKGVDKVVIAQEEYSVEDERLYVEKYLPSDRYLMPAIVIYDDGREEEYEVYVEIPEKYFIQTGIVDMYIGKNYVSGNKEVLGVDTEYQDDIYDRGRLAYFGQGKFNDKLRVTAHIDTREDEFKNLFKDLHKSDTSSIFERVEDDDKYYSVYGDDSYIERVVNTQGKLYLDVMYDKSSYMWGNYNTGLTATEFSQYNRSLYGAKADYRTRATTSYGEDRLNLVGFLSEATSLTSHDEFLGTGGSLYFLKHGDVIEGSDKVAVKLVDKTTGVTKDIVYLQEGRDYSIDNYQGRVILERPLSDISSDSFSSIIDNSPRDGYENYLIVDYEYVPRSSSDLDNLVKGGRVKGFINDNLGIGATYVDEEKEGYNYKMEGVDISLRATEGTYLTTEYSRSEGTQVDSNFVSLDGGLSFDKIDNPNREDKSGDAFRVSGVLSLYDLAPKVFNPYGNEIRAWYERKDAYYSYANSDDNLYFERYGSEVRLRPSNRLQFELGYSKSLEEDELGKTVTDTTETSIGGEYSLNDKVVVGTEYKYVEEIDEGEIGDGHLIGARIDYDITDETSVYTKAQTTLSKGGGYSDNDLYTIGGETKVGSRLNLGAEASKGSRGSAVDATADFSVTDDYDLYLGYVIENDSESNQNSIVFGQRATLSSKVDIYQENQFVNENNGKGRTDSYGIDYELKEDHSIGVSFQYGKLKKEDEDTRRKAISLYHDFTLGRSSFKNKFEYRQDKGDERIDQYLTTNSFRHKLTKEYEIGGKLNYSITKNQTTGKKENEYTEGNLGFAYRPIYNDKLNILGRYTYLQDEEKESDRDIAYKDEKSHIIETEGIYSYNEHFDYGLKLAFKHKEEAFERASGGCVDIKSRIYLAGVKVTYYMMHNWDIFGQYHWKVDDYENDLEQGAIVAINRHVGENLKIGVGYNFSKFEDDLKRDDYNAHGWFINLVGKF